MVKSALLIRNGFLTFELSRREIMNADFPSAKYSPKFFTPDCSLFFEDEIYGKDKKAKTKDVIKP